MTPENGPPDDQSIADNVPLWRRVVPKFRIYDENRGCFRLSSQAFQNYPGTNAFSVWISSDAEELGEGPEDLVADHPGYGVASFNAGLARELNQGVVRDPQEEEPAHGHVVGHKTRGMRKRFAKGSDFLIEPS